MKSGLQKIEDKLTNTKRDDNGFPIRTKQELAKFFEIKHAEPETPNVA